MTEQEKRRLRSKRAMQAERRFKALAMRKQGCTYEEIAQALGITKSSAWRLVNRQLRMQARLAEEEAKVLLQLELERLDALQQAVWEQAMQGHLGAVDRVLRIMERRAKLLGLEAQSPSQPEPKIEIIMPAEIADDREA